MRKVKEDLEDLSEVREDSNRTNSPRDDGVNYGYSQSVSPKKSKNLEEDSMSNLYGDIESIYNPDKSGMSFFSAQTKDDKLAKSI